MTARFARVMAQVSLPMLRDAGIDVVAFRPCLDGQQTFTLMRAYRDRAHHGESQGRFYVSDAWQRGPRQEVLDCIEVISSVVIDADAPLLAGLRRA